MDFYREAKRLYGGGRYAEALALLGECQGEHRGLGQLREFYFLALSAAIETKAKQRFNELFYQMKKVCLRHHGMGQWIGCVEEMLGERHFPEFFIRAELIVVYQETGRVSQLHKMCQRQMDQSVKRHRSNIELMAYQDILGKRVAAYDLLHRVYRGQYQEVTQGLERLRGEWEGREFEQVINFIAANISPSECKRIEVSEVIVAHLAKKRELEILYYSGDDILSFAKLAIRSFINLMLLNLEQSGAFDHVFDLVEFLIWIGEKELGEDILALLEKSLEAKNNSRIKGLRELCAQRDTAQVGARELGEETKAGEGWGGEIAAESDSDLAVGRAMVWLAAKTDQWLVDNFAAVMANFMELGLHKLILEMAHRMKKVGDESISLIDINYFEVESNLRLGNYIAVIKLCREILDTAGRKNLSVNDELCFEYLKGEAYFAFGERAKAHKSFKRVFDMDASYRLARERLQALEKN